MHSLDPERKFLSVFVNDKLINNSSTRAAPSGPRFQGDRRWASSDWSADIMYPMKRLPIVAIQQPGAAESTWSQSLQSVYSHRRQDEGAEQAASSGTNTRARPARLTSTDTPFYSTCLLWCIRTKGRPRREKSCASEPWSYIRAEEAPAASQGRCDSLINNTGSPDRCMNDCLCERPAVKEICEGSPIRLVLKRTGL